MLFTISYLMISKFWGSISQATKRKRQMLKELEILNVLTGSLPILCMH